MITGEPKSKIGKAWDACWSGGISNPLDVIDEPAVPPGHRQSDTAPYGLPALIEEHDSRTRLGLNR